MCIGGVVEARCNNAEFSEGQRSTRWSMHAHFFSNLKRSKSPFNF
jgi:hypothetical protein